MELSEAKGFLTQLGFNPSGYPVIPILHGCGGYMDWVLKIEGDQVESLGAFCQRCRGVHVDVPLERLRELTPADIQKARLVAQITQMEDEAVRREQAIAANVEFIGGRLIRLVGENAVDRDG